MRPHTSHPMRFDEILRYRLTRRQALKVGLVASAATLARPSLALGTETRRGAAPSFTPIQPQTSDEIVVPEGFRAEVLLRWGDPLFPGVPEFSLEGQTAALQERQAGFNCDYLMFFPLPLRSQSPFRGLLWVNHEFTNGLMMFPGYDPDAPTREQVDIELAAHGVAIVGVEGGPAGGWRYLPGEPRNRRITMTTPMRISGPAAGHPWLRTSADPSGQLVLGTLNNCGGAVTPWGTGLAAEENFDRYFANRAAVGDPALAAAHARYGLPSGASQRKWERFIERFNLAQEPHEPFRFGWMVEVDPYDQTSTPVKRTALGRFKHEAAAMVVSSSGRIAAYSGDDERFEHVYKFVSDHVFDPLDRQTNMDLLDSGTLHAARFDPDGGGEWVPLVFGVGPLVPPAFTSQADVLIRTRDAARALGATMMDRPEDIETNPVTGKVYMSLTNNTRRGVGTDPGPDAANPRGPNRFGHVIELTEDGGDPTSTRFRWEMFLLCGDPSDPSTYFAGFDKSQVSPIANPDNLTFDGHGNLWIATDGQGDRLGVNDAIHAVPTRGAERGRVMQFLSAVRQAEVASLVFNPTEQALFASIQHPGAGGSLASPLSVWPHPPSGPARPAVVVVWREDGGPISR